MRNRNRPTEIGGRGLYPYRLKSLIDGHERVTMEDELSWFIPYFH